MYKKIFFIGVFIFLTTLPLSRPVFVLAVNSGGVGGAKDEIEDLNKAINDKKKKIQELEEAMAAAQKNLNAKNLETVSLKNQLSILDNRTVQLETQIQLTQAKISETSLQIEALDLTIKEKQLIIARQKAIVAKMIQNIHAQDQKNYIEILLTSPDFADFYNQLKYLESVYGDLGRSLKTLRIASADLFDKKTQVEQKRATYENLQEQLTNNKQDLVEEGSIKQNLLVQTKSSELKYKILLNNLKRQYQIIENDIRTLEEKMRKKLSEQNQLSKLSDSSSALSWPVPGRYVTSIFHDPDYPYRRVFEHSGIDVRAGQGTPVRAAGSGYVGITKFCSTASCYSYVLLIHNGDISTLYGHLSRIVVKTDQYVDRGSIIGYSGGTPGTAGAGPFVTGPHLHFEVRQSGIPVDPMRFLED